MSHDEKYLLALSGGADSVALLLAVKALGYEVEAVHCNFRLRGEESDRDEAFCQQFCRSQGVQLHLAHFDTRFYAQTHKVSIEMAARQLRYQHFERLMADIHAQGILVAHHQDDSVETVLMNLIRGTGLHGLTGISPRNGHIIRPLLCLTRQEVEQFLEQCHQSYITDSSNLVADVVRNKIRLQLLPILRTINPSVSDSIAATAERLRLAADIFDEAIDQKVRAARISVDEPCEAAYDVEKIDSEYTLFQILNPLHFSPSQIEVIARHLKADTGTVYDSPDYQLLFDRGRMIIIAREDPFKTMKLPIPGLYVLPGGDRLRIEVTAVDGHFEISRDACRVCVDADQVVFPLTLRTCREGDRFRPLGMKGSRLVSDFLTDRKFSLFQKRRQLVLTDADDRIVWLVALRPDHRVRITPATRKALILTLQS